MAFEKTVPVWNAPGAEPPASLKDKGFEVGYKPPADYFNWFWHGVSECLKELQGDAFSAKAVVLGEGANLDECLNVGIYTYSISAAASIVNAPEKTQTTFLVLPRLMNGNSENIVQILYTQTNCIYLRNRADGAWNGWRKMLKDSDVVSVENGGTGAKTAPEALASLGAAPADHGRHVPKTCVTIEDWNDAVETGWYMGEAVANSPTDKWYFGFVIAHNESFVLQEVYNFTNSSTKATELAKYIRSRHNGTWTPWENVTVQQVVHKDAKLEFIKTLTADAQAQINDKMNKKPNLIELVPASGGAYIDFHFDGSDADFTARIIETTEGLLEFVCRAKVSSTYQPVDEYLLRNQKLKSSVETPTVNGQICWLYE